MGDHPRIQSAHFINGIGGRYVARPGAENRDRIGFGLVMGAELDIAIDTQTRFSLVIAGTVVREVPLEYAGITTATWQSTSVGATVEAHFDVFERMIFLGAGLNPRAVIYAQGLPPEFDLGVVACLTAVFGPFGLSLNVGGGLRLGDIDRTSFETGLVAFLGLG
ncbi:MAG TPA: hypothetical protein VFX30_02745 [bacterium]|nr:hypothetical protein [bacterium]